MAQVFGMWIDDAAAIFDGDFSGSIPPQTIATAIRTYLESRGPIPA